MDGTEEAEEEKKKKKMKVQGQEIEFMLFFMLFHVHIHTIYPPDIMNAFIVMNVHSTVKKKLFSFNLFFSFSLNSIELM